MSWAATCDACDASLTNFNNQYDFSTVWRGRVVEIRVFLVTRHGATTPRVTHIGLVVEASSPSDRSQKPW